MMEERDRRAPRVFEVENDYPPNAPSSDAARRPRAVDASMVAFEDDALVLEEVVPPEPIRRRRIGWWGVVVSCLLGLFGLWLALAIEALIGHLFAAAPWAGIVGLALLVALIAALAVLALREVLAIRRLGRRADLAERAAAALAARDDAAAESVARDLYKLFESRPETAKGREWVSDAFGMVMDARERLYHAEDAILGAIDERAVAAAGAASRRVSVVTAVAPRALIDIAYVLLENARLVRTVATLYGLRPGKLGFLRLLRDVLGHLAVTGVVSVGDGIVEQAFGHGVASRVSARLGEGVLNGLLTARVGAAAIDLCRPLPFRARQRPTAREVLRTIGARTSSVR